MRGDRCKWNGMPYVQGGVSLQQRTEARNGKLASAFSRICRCFPFLVYTDQSNLAKPFTTLILLCPMLLSLTMVWLPRPLPPPESSFFSFMLENFCNFLMVVLLVLSRQYWEGWITKTAPQLLLSQKCTQLGVHTAEGRCSTRSSNNKAPPDHRTPALAPAAEGQHRAPSADP